MKILLLLLLPWIVFALDSSNLENEQYNLNKNQLEYFAKQASCQNVRGSSLAPF